MSGMFNQLKGGALWAATAVVLGIIGAATYLASQAILSGSDWLVVGTSILTGAVGITTAHVTGNAVGNALNTPPPAPGVPAAVVASEPAPAPPGNPI